MPRKLVCCVMVVLHALLEYEQDAILCKILVNEKRFSKWLQCLSAVCDTENLNPGRSVICSKHVVPRFITLKSRLLGDAYPSLFNDDGLSIGLPSSSNTEIIFTWEHSYARKSHVDHTY
ncbi:unnamed protein product [Diatraea saccharalis]|uniref:Uncharacterized protein n=1 Tax=Diatraea saccharalis TaxID=40085 RepID=A0A9N9R824_9NEOP|nr:unnamed protein product [Diatraea saccharalis]